MAGPAFSHGKDEENGAIWQIEAWTGPGGLSDWRTIEENRLTRNALSDSDHVVFSYTYPDGNVEYRTFRGPVEVDNIENIIDEWKVTHSL